MHERRDRYPGYDVLAKWSGPSWNDKTRDVITRRLSIAPEPRFFTRDEYETVVAIADRIVPQPAVRPPVPIAALVDRKLAEQIMDGFRRPGVPRDGEAWRRGLKALNAESAAAYDKRFAELPEALQDKLLRAAQSGELKAAEWGGLRCEVFFKHRLGRDIVLAYYAHPTAWSEIGWGGPASPRGYVRLDLDERDPWEAAEAKDGNDATARRSNRGVR
ncbi:gluconate 2-dehydrogenase subunit 3 family protein [Bradyrhizobium sp. CCBAU 51627]|uniref:gluconate 2-dehydrogenase subunit 3 family protein n=1 Tax=Bradyrhizobium sp. CCBAU 51627 TaxID=1325088 RepID=UPI0023064A99|nr:gluconate 2-dehydrogenase subunit 3 family protein [Bradyrhizobium sp. CCBAU 51627]MDA9431072.1 gluconate 2-dehydrogenase subunit 3 [Bradyrhizobium sp. CCBAU 51627]